MLATFAKRVGAIFASPDISWRKAFAIAATFGVCAFYVQSTDFGFYVEQRLAWTMQFRVRELAGIEPKIDSRLKVRTIDNFAVAALGDRDLTLKQWATLLSAYAKKKPKMILIDRFFGNPTGGAKDAQLFVETLQKMETPVVIGTLRAEDKIVLNYPLPKMNEHRIPNDLLAASASGERTVLDQFPAAGKHLFYFYGPNKSIAPAFHHIGHFVHAAGIFTVTPILRRFKEYAIPHMSFYASEPPYRIEKDGFYVNNQRIPLTHDYRIAVNFSSKDGYAKFARSMQWDIEALMEGKPKAYGITEGDVVLILPAYHTGHTDFIESPWGPIAGGLMQASLANSVLTGQWLTPINVRLESILLAVVAGVIVGAKFNALAFIWALLISTVVAMCGSIYLFAYHGMIIPWMYPSLVLVTTSVAIFAERKRVHEGKTKFIRSALSKFVSEERLRLILENPNLLSTEAVGRNVSVMFIDIVGYSVVAEELEPKEAFKILKTMLHEMTEEILNFGGVIDKTLGDGVLCFFGYHFDGSQTLVDHATQAVDCAIAIQRKILAKNLMSAEANSASFPVRIGINTDYIYIGNVGDENKIDFTLVGDGVNFASRLESACAPYHVMIGPATRDQLTTLASVDAKITKRLIQIKHHENLIEAYEVDPFVSSPDLVIKATEAHRKTNNVSRKDSRIPVPDGQVIAIDSNVGRGRMHNFSEGGFAVVLDEYLGNGVNIQVQLGDEGSELRLYLQSLGLSPLFCEVRWARHFRGQFLHGLMIKNPTAIQKQNLLLALRKATRKSVIDDAAA